MNSSSRDIARMKHSSGNQEEVPTPTLAQDLEGLAYLPGGGPIKKWLAGFLLAAVPIGYGVHCLMRGYTTLPQKQSSSLVLKGEAGMWLAIAYIAVGAFLHFHYFWGLSDRLWRGCQFGKGLSLLVFAGAMLYVFYLMALE